MGWELRIVLLIVSLATAGVIIASIRRNRMQIGHSIYWLCFSALIILLAVFPRIASFASHLLGIQSPANLIYLVFIFVLAIKTFSLTVKLSAMDEKITALTEYIALHKSGEDKEC